ncbi:unnamed protein product [Zymoseptoria tritici ST99CH_1A5]|uniref:Uncharacterized protein n=2 Tax=Zymoseptoria tritici TaxID=1047171 RepID=A0A2H1GGS9_ZYMTR|nr:unnamed protein product [Zymoseptoria tritici ST99CH_1E4]SMR54072.1 unnamed protein product [Zymoseptoria tritici ST99CH_3D1]SMY24511.1 unnamed protein product [Zymoseptoria tritici ST99CH_1A5]
MAIAKRFAVPSEQLAGLGWSESVMWHDQDSGAELEDSRRGYVPGAEDAKCRFAEVHASTCSMQRIGTSECSRAALR